MNKSEMVDAVAKATKISKKDSETAVNAFLDTVTKTLMRGDKVVLVGFGTFEVKKRAARIGRNPSTKKAMNIPESKAPVFKAGKGLKEKVNK
jgi:DNA-binding protein HU-beta